MMYLLVTGPLVGDPQSRDGAKGPFTTANIRVAGDNPVLISLTAFGDLGQRLLEYTAGDALSISGRAKLTSWTGRDGAERHGVSVTVEQIASVKPRPRGRPPQPTLRGAQRRLPRIEAPLHDDPIDDLFWPAGGEQ